jgi:predicted MFS family arabinose efflux permease
MLAMVLFGVGEVLGCFFIGQVVDRLGSKAATVAICVIQLVMGGITMAYIIIYKYGVLAYLLCFIWGFQDSAVNAHIQGLLGFEFDNPDVAYSVLNSMMAITCILF